MNNDQEVYLKDAIRSLIKLGYQMCSTLEEQCSFEEWLEKIANSEE